MTEMTPEPLPPAAGNAFQAFVQLVQWVDLTFGGGVESINSALTGAMTVVILTYFRRATICRKHSAHWHDLSTLDRRTDRPFVKSRGGATDD